MTIFWFCNYIYSVVWKDSMWQYINIANIYILTHKKVICDNILMLQILSLRSTKYFTWYKNKILSQKKSGLIKKQDLVDQELENTSKIKNPIEYCSNIQKNLRPERIIFLMKFAMVSLKEIKSLAHFCWLELRLYPNCIWDSHDLLIVFVGRLLKIVKGFKTSKKQMI